MKKMQVYIAIRGADNISENSDVPAEKLAMFSRVTRPVQTYRVDKTRWCVLRWPSPSMAQSAGMSTEAFENLYFDVCTMDYAKMARAMVPLHRRMERADLRAEELIEVQPGGSETLLKSGGRISYAQDSVILEDLIATIVARAKASRDKAAP